MKLAAMGWLRMWLLYSNKINSIPQVKQLNLYQVNGYKYKLTPSVQVSLELV